MSIPWTPFTSLPSAAVTPSGLLQLDIADQEVELLRRGPLELRWEDDDEPRAPRPEGGKPVWESRHAGLVLTVTTHRLVFQESTAATTTGTITTTATTSKTKSNTSPKFVHMSNVHQIETTGGPSLLHPNASYKLILCTYTYGNLLLCFSNKKDRDALEQQIQKALQRKAWEVAARLQEAQLATHQQTRRRVGVDHILTKHKLKHQQAQKVATEALSGDAEQLLEQASALLQVIQKYTILLNQQQQQQQKQHQGQDPNEDDDQDAKRLTGLLQDMGMTSALTKDHVGDDRAYYEWLARQVVDFFWEKLPAMGGVISLTDVYCLFNRARGTNLVSPEDLREACNLLGDLKLGISQRTFDSGIVVLQLDRQTNTSALLAMCPISALEASHVLKVSPLLAMEQLKEAEKEGHLCRDTTLETTRFYPNRFEVFYKQLQQQQQQ